MAYAIPIITDIQTGYEFKDKNLEFLNQPNFYIPFTTKIHLPKPKWKNIKIFIPKPNNL